MSHTRVVTRMMRTARASYFTYTSQPLIYYYYFGWISAAHINDEKHFVFQLFCHLPFAGDQSRSDRNAKEWESRVWRYCRTRCDSNISIGGQMCITQIEWSGKCSTWGNEKGTQQTMETYERSCLYLVSSMNGKMRHTCYARVCPLCHSFSM